jgi:hypothetical protein
MLRAIEVVEPSHVSVVGESAHVKETYIEVYIPSITSLVVVWQVMVKIWVVVEILVPSVLLASVSTIAVSAFRIHTWYFYVVGI